jgi:hypothetical protein
MRGMAVGKKLHLEVRFWAAGRVERAAVLAAGLALDGAAGWVAGLADFTAFLAAD